MKLNRVVTAIGLTICISVSKTKLLAAGSGITQEDLIPICIDGDVIETASSFCYLGSIVEGRGGVALEL